MVDTGSWLPGRKILLSTNIISQLDLKEKSIQVELNYPQIESSPDIDTIQPISRQQEEELHAHYGWPIYWIQGIHFLTEEGIELLADTLEKLTTENNQQHQFHLRNVEEITGYRVRATDGEVGIVEDFIVDDKTWVIESLVIDTSNWFAGRKVLVSSQMVEAISWTEAKIHLSLPTSTIENSPEFDPTAPVNTVSQLQFYDYQGRPRD